ncbi:MAG: TIR domain-containing protein [Desulfobacteraceae bacterium]|jgi:WD40 repeat protein
MAEEQKKYKAFISYKHSVSSRVAVALETALRRYAKPIFKPPISIFRDEDQMSAGVDLKASIRSALENSDYLVYIATREAAESPYVREELETWCRELGRQDKLIIVWQKDGLADNPQDNTILWEASDALPSNLEPHLRGIPIWLDLTWASTDDDLNLRNPGYRVLVNSIMARFRGIAPEALTGVEIRTHRRNIRIRNSAIVVLAVLIIFSLMAVTRALTEREQARINQLTYRSSQLMTADTTLALRFAYEAWALALPDPSPQIRQLLLQAFYQDDPEYAWRYVTKLSPGGGLKDARFSLDGQQVVILGQNGSVRIWTADGGLVERAITMENGIVRVRFSDDGQLLLTTGYMDKTVMVWHTDGSRHDALEVLPSEWPYAEFQPGGRKVLILSGVGFGRPTVTVWDPKGNKLSIKEENIRWARFTPDGKHILTYQPDGMLRRWTTSGQYKGYKTISRRCHMLALSPDGSYLLAMPDRSTIEIWDLDGQRVNTIDLKGPGFRSMEIAPNGDYVAAVLGDGAIRLWDRFGEPVWDGRDHPIGVESCSFAPDSKRLLTVSKDSTVRIWDLSGRMVGQCNGRLQRIKTARFSPDGTSVLTAATDGTARVWKAPRPAVITIDTRTDRIQSVEFLPDGKRLLTLSGYGRISVRSLGGDLLSLPLTEEKRVDRVYMSPQGKYILTSDAQRYTLKLWRQADGALHRTLEGHQAPVRHAAFSSDGRYLISESDRHNALVWDTEGRLFPICAPFAHRLQSARFLPESRTILAWCKDGKLRLLDFDGRIIPSGFEQLAGIESYDISCNGRYITCSFEDGRSAVFSRDGVKLACRQKNDMHVGITFIPDGSGYVRVTPSGSGKILDAKGTIRGQWNYPMESKPHSARVSPDSKTVIIPMSGEIRTMEGYLLGDIPDAFEAFFPHGQLVLTSTPERMSTLNIRDLSGRVVVSCGTVRKEGRYPTSPPVRFSSDSSRFIVTSHDGTQKIYLTADGIFSYLQAEGLYAFTSEDRKKFGITWLGGR